MEIDCGQCMGCKLERARQWAARIMHEAKQHKHNWFATLTYDDQQLPENGSLQPEDFVLFMKRFRHSMPDIRYYQVGEYGETTGRPHHHAILFNCPLQDLKLIRNAREKTHALYTSAELERAWGKGLVSVGAVTMESALYCAAYVTKRYTNPDLDKVREHYQGRLPEYATMSRRPGIARDYFKKHSAEIFNAETNGTIIINGRQQKAPKYYETLLRRVDSDLYAQVKERRIDERTIRTHKHREAREAKLKTNRQLKGREPL